MPHIRATKNDFVLDVGSGHYPHSTADVLVERFLGETEHRSKKRLVHDRPLVCADIHALPFRNKAFDYVICNQVLEHVDDPARALHELARVGRRGYLAVPSEFQEFICPTREHRWVFALKNGELWIKPKSEVHTLGLKMYGGVFHHLYHQADFRRLALYRPQLFAVLLEWEGKIDYRLVAADAVFYDYEDRAAMEPLLAPTPADDWFEGLKRWFRIHLDFTQMYHLTRLRGLARRWLRGKSRVRA